MFLPDGRPDIQGFEASQDIKGDDHNLDLYMELLVPLLRDVPGVQSLETVLGYRSSDYASAGRFDSWKAELLYQPVESLRVRGSYQDAVRAPSVFELYLPQVAIEVNFSFDDVHDPCTVDSPERTGTDAASVEALCLAQGMPASVLPTFVDSDELATGIQGGNPGLEQEAASTVTLGLVWTSPLDHPALSSLQLSLDWYQIEIDDKIWFVVTRISSPTATTPATTRISPSRTSGVRFSAATRPAARSRTCTRCSTMPLTGRRAVSTCRSTGGSILGPAGSG